MNTQIVQAHGVGTNGGQYIGHHKIEHEYLNDEESIDFVFVWHLIPVVKDEEDE